MIRDIETLGLKIEEINPCQNKISVPVDSNITIKFNAYINKATIVNNIILTKSSTEERIPCAITCHDDIVTLAPKLVLDKKEKYKIYIPKNGISDILGRKLLSDFVCYFFTEIEEYSVRPVIIEPKNSIYPTIRKIIYSSYDNSNIIEISNSKSFNLIIYSQLVNNGVNISTTHEMTNGLPDGLYYLRIITSDNVESEYTQFYLSSGEGRVSNDDYATEVNDLNVEEAIELIEFRPMKEIVNLNRKCIYYKFDGKIDTATIDKCKNYVFGESISSVDEDITSHEYVDYNLIYMYNAVENITYIIFEINEGG